MPTTLQSSDSYPGPGVSVFTKPQKNAKNQILLVSKHYFLTKHSATTS